MTLKLAQFWDDPNNISTKSSYPQKIFIFLKTPKNIEIQNFEPKKMVRAYVCVKISEYPPWGLANDNLCQLNHFQIRPASFWQEDVLYISSNTYW